MRTTLSSALRVGALWTLPLPPLPPLPPLRPLALLPLPPLALLPLPLTPLALSRHPLWRRAMAL